ncbi:hypothetical protein [Rhizobium mongolense]|uniref:Uncharacterized protein n=1 Tax=Rhizobium mongolense TaxID=57676 RepID=A0ABR6IW12_9HYPH|nr:hypothetical protein [Rhizobium mongolense]MBB4232094.1 hypothetical protein [Rhizobium mongolense]
MTEQRGCPPRQSPRISTGWFHSLDRISGRKRGFTTSRMKASQAAANMA